MADIRPIPYSVGQYEAQVFDLSGMTRVMAQQAAAQRKAQADAKKEMDKMMANTYSTKGKGRLQDMPELEKQYQELQNYYINNNSAILKGGKESLEFQKMRSNFIFEADEANMRKERDKQLSPYFKMNLEKEGMSEKSTELMTIFNLPYNDPRRKDYRYEGADGQMHGIDELNVADVEKYRRFNESELMSNIVKTAPIRKIKDLQIQPSENYNLPKGYSIAVTGEYALRDPMAIAQAVTGELAGKPDARNFYGNMYRSETEESLQNASDELKMFNQIYKAAGYTQFVNTETDNQPGITNETEYALYRNLKSNLPQDLGDKISTQLVSAKQGMERLELARQNAAFQRRKWREQLSLQQQNLPDDQAANAWFSQPRTDAEIQEYVNSEAKVIGMTFAGGGGALPAIPKYFKPGTFNASKHAPGLSGTGSPSAIDKTAGVIVYTTQEMALDSDNQPITDIDDARKEYGSAYEYKTDKNGNVYKVESVAIPVDVKGVTKRNIGVAERGASFRYAYTRATQAQFGSVQSQVMKSEFQEGAGARPMPNSGINIGKKKGPTLKKSSTFVETNSRRGGTD
jgi:hypothetical protein